MSPEEMFAPDRDWWLVPQEWTKEDPAYYRGRSGKFDIVEVIADFGLDFDLGCVAKYIFRAGKKPGADFLTDLRKALRVLERRVERECNR